MELFIDFATGSLNKKNEELCGDKVEFYNDDEQFIAVLSDGLGSGVKANILATLTSTIALTMLKNGMEIDDVVDTIIQTLPVCAVRKIAYSTFTIVKINKDGMAYVTEFENPGLFFLRGKEIKTINWNNREINGKMIRESRFKIQESDVLIFVSDGVIYAGVGESLNLGWQRPDIIKYIKRRFNEDMTAKNMTNNLLGACNQLYMEEPGDDTTVATIKVMKPNKSVLFSGPPIDKNLDSLIVEEIMSTRGKKIVCGGTAANIVARELGKEVTTSFEIIDKDVPPIGYIDGIDLVTEGVLTLQKAADKLERLLLSTDYVFMYERDGASKLARMLFEDCTHIKFIVGRSINPAHQNPNFPNELSIKLYVLNRLKDVLIKLGKIIEVKYY